MTTTNARSTTSDTLFQHVSRPDWGLAILAWEHDGKRGYQFEDGHLRVFKSGYFGFLAPVDRPVDESTRVLAELGRAIGRQRAARRMGADHPPVALADQIEYFSSLFPKGFQGVSWAKKHRGIDARTALKRHRNPIIQRAAELFAPERLAAQLEAGRATEVVGEMLSIIESTDLVTKAQSRGMERVDGVAAERLVRALAELLKDDSDVTASFDAWVAALSRALQRKPTWALATAFPALARPHRFTAVKPTTFASAAAWMAPSLIIDVQPTGRVYQRLLDMTDTLAQKLGEAGLRPRDRMDLFDFIDVTLRPKAIKEIVARSQKEVQEDASDRHDDQQHGQDAEHAAA